MGHWRQLVLAVKAYVPARQIEHVDNPVLFEIKPALHGTQKELPLEFCTVKSNKP